MISVERLSARLRSAADSFDWWGTVHVIVFCLALLSLPAAVLTYWTDSEIWAVSSNSMLFRAPQDFAFGMKPFFNFLLYIASQLPSAGFKVLPMDWARIFFGFNALCMTWLTGRMVKELTGSYRAAIAGAAILVTCSVFTYHGQRVRSDLLATTAFLGHLIFVFRLQRSYTRRAMIRSAGAAGVLLLASLTATPGAVYLLIASVPIYWSVLAGFPSSIRRRLLLGGAACAVVGGALVWFFKPEFVLSHGLLAAGSFYVQTFGSSEFGWPYWHPMRFLHVYKLVVQNPLFASALLVSFGLFLFGRLKGEPISKAIRLWAWFSLIAFALMLLHPSKLPFFIASYLPFFAVFLATYGWERRWPTSRVSPMVIGRVGVLIFIVLTYLTLNRQFQLMWTLGNREQRAVVEALRESVHRFPGLSYYDVIGLLPDRDPLPYFLGPGQKEANERAAEFILKTRPDVIVGVQKLEAIRPMLEPLLRERYLLLPQGLYVKAAIVDLDEAARNSGFIATSQLAEALQAAFDGHDMASMEVMIKFYDHSYQELYPEDRRASRPILKLARKIRVAELLREFPLLPIPSGAERVVLSPFVSLVPETSSPMDVLFRFDPEL